MRIHAIQTGRVQIKAAQIEGRGHGLWRQLQPVVSHEWAEWSPVYAWAIEHPEGVIVVDTGSGAHLKRLPRWHPYFQFAVRFDIEPEQEMGPQLRSLGIGDGDVKTVVLTHLHVDHDGGLAHFARSRILADGDESRAHGWHKRRAPWLPAGPVAEMVRPAAARLAAIAPRTVCPQRTHHGRRRYHRCAKSGPHPEPHLRPRARRRRRDHAGRRCVVSGIDHAARHRRRREPRRKYRAGDARRHPRIVCRASDDLFADARPELGRAAPRTTRRDHRRSCRRRSRISLVDD